MEKTRVGPFEILERLGSNRRQRVFRALQVEQQREFALKFISIPPNYDRVLALEKLRLEFAVLRELRHPNLVRIYGAGVDGDSIFIASELVDGESLASLLSRRGRMAPDLVVDYARQVALCLEYLHAQDMIHSKITPDKILIDRNGIVRLTDLRLNRSKKRRWDNTRHRDAELAAYLAPEQLTGFATAKSDLYSLGTIMYEMLVGRLPFPAENIARLTRRKLEDRIEPVATQVLSCPVWLDRLVMQLIEPTPRKRPHSAHAVRLALEEIVRIDATKRSAVDELSGAFNPLHINMDKSEARALLNKAHVESQPFWKNWRHWTAMVGAIAVTTMLILILWMPANVQRTIDEARALVASRDPQAWARAREKLADIPSDRLSDEQRQEIDEIILRSKRQSLLRQAKNGESSALDTESVRHFIEAFKLEQDFEFDQAFQLYRQLVHGPPTVDEHVRREAQQGMVRTELLRTLPAGKVALLAWIKQANVTTKEQEARLRDLLQQLIDTYESMPSHESLLQAAKQRIEELDAKQRGDQIAAEGGKGQPESTNPSGSTTTK